MTLILLLLLSGVVQAEKFVCSSCTFGGNPNYSALSEEIENGIVFTTTIDCTDLEKASAICWKHLPKIEKKPRVKKVDIKLDTHQDFDYAYSLYPKCDKLLRDWNLHGIRPSGEELNKACNDVKKVEKPKCPDGFDCTPIRGNRFAGAAKRTADKMAKEAEFEKLLNEVELELEDHCWHPKKYDGPVPAYCFKIVSDSIVTQLKINRAKIREELGLLSRGEDNKTYKDSKSEPISKCRFVQSLFSKPYITINAYTNLYRDFCENQ